MRITAFRRLSLLVALTAMNFGNAQSHPSTLPCTYSGKIRRTAAGAPEWFGFEEMKQRAVRKVDITGPLRQLDVRGTVKLDVLAGVSGEVICLRRRVIH